MMTNPLENLFGNTNINFGPSPVSPLNNAVNEKEKETVPVQETKEADNQSNVSAEVQTETNDALSTINESAEVKQEENQQIIDDKEENSNDLDESESDNTSDDDTEEESQKEEPKKKRRRRRTKAEMEEARKAEESSIPSTEEKTEEQSAPQNENNSVEKDVETSQPSQSEPENKSVGSNYKKVSTKIIKEYLTPNVEDPEWDEQVEYIEKELAKLKKFDSEINEGSIRIMVPLYANLGLYVAPMRSEYKAMLAILEDKDSGLISYQKAVNAIGTNEAARKTNAFNACGNYKAEGMKNPIDLIDYTHLVRYRYEYLDGVMQQIDIAKSALISFLTVISKIEK